MGSSSSRLPTEGVLLVSLTEISRCFTGPFLRLLVGSSGTGRVKTQEDRSRKGSRKSQAEEEKKSRKDRNAEEVESIVSLDQKKQEEAPQTGRGADRKARKKSNPDEFGAEYVL